MAYTIICNSSTDLTQEMATIYSLKVVPLKYNIKDETFVNNLDHREMSIQNFYQKLREGTVATTSQINVAEYEKAILEEFDKGKDVLILSFSSALSGSYNAARIAIENLKENKNKVYLVDTKSASLGEGLLVYLAAAQKQKGKSIEEVYEYVNNLIPHLAHWFTVDDLMFLRRGGRLSGAGAILGTGLCIKPILHIDNEGRLIPRYKAIGRKRSLHRLVSILDETIDPSISKSVFISHGDDHHSALLVKEKIEALNRGLNVELINFIGPVIGAHSGPGTVAVFFTAKQR